jgi:hypothetical protein
MTGEYAVLRENGNGRRKTCPSTILFTTWTTFRMDWAAEKRNLQLNLLSYSTATREYYSWVKTAVTLCLKHL